MKTLPIRLLVPALCVLLLGACASAPRTSAPPPATVNPPPVPPAAVGSPTAVAPAAPAAAQAAAGPAEQAHDAAPPSATATAASDAAADQAEQDFEALYGGNGVAQGGDTASGAPPAYDPWEGFNRKVYAFNNVVDRAVARPLARGYVAVVPQPLRQGVSNFFDNLRLPVTMVNQLLQGRPLRATQSLGRFLLNSTLGIGGLLDPASDARLPRRNEDFGQTLGVWGWQQSRYVVLPLFGPRTVRDVFGLAGDLPLSPTRQIEDDKVRIGLQGLQLVDARAQLLPLDSLREGAVDEYAMVRDAWLQRRAYQIQNDRRRPKAEDDHLPEYLRDSPEVPVDIVPIPGN